MPARQLIRCMLVITCAAAPAVQARSALQDSTDLKIRNSSGVDALGSENTVFIHPSDSRIVLIAQNSHAGGVDAVNAWVSQDGGKTWIGDNTAGGPDGYGDPAAVILRSQGASPARYLVGMLAIKSEGGLPGRAQNVVYKDSPTSLTWIPDEVVNTDLGGTDKNHLWPDNHPNTNPLWARRLYAAWSNTEYPRLEAMYSFDRGISWDGRQNIDPSGLKAEWGVNLKVAIDPINRGHVYAVWGESVNHVPKGRTNRIMFNKSVDGGFIWGTAIEIAAPGINGYTVGQVLASPDIGMGVTSAPSMAVDSLGGIYVVWAQKDLGGTEGTDAEVFLIKSTNEGTSWSSPLRVIPNNAHQWHPWVTWDDCTNAVVVIFFDNRTDVAKAETYIAVSYNGAASFPAANEVKIGDVAWSGDVGPISAGEYIGIAARDGIAYPGWSDDRESVGTFKVYTSPIYLWGVTQTSIQHTVSSAPEMVLSVGVDWNTSMPAFGPDYFVLIAPSGFVYTVSGTGTGTGHSLSRICACEPGWWRYVVKSTRPGFTTRGSDERKFLAVCVD